MKWLAVVFAALAFAPSAYAQGATIQAVDSPSSWSPEEVTIKAGETVTWTFTGTTENHNVISRGTNWSYRSGDWQIAGPPVSHKFDTPGRYEFACEVHPTMDGFVNVTDTSGTPPPPPPPPPLSEQPFANDQPSLTVFERPDEIRPRLRAVRAAPVRNGARVRFRLSEPARVTVRIKLAGITIKSARRTFEGGRRKLILRDRRLEGRYRVEVFARDLAGNRSQTERTTVRVR